MAKIKRSQWAHYLNTGTVLSPVWNRIGQGVTDATLNMNPQTVTEQYIDEDSATTEVEAYQPTFPMTQTCIPGDDVYDFIEDLFESRAVLDAAHAELVNVRKYKTPVGAVYPAEKQTVSIAVSTFVGPGGESNKLEYTINYIGDGVEGSFDVTPGAEVFTADSS
jgi:hypothetical protein